MWLCSLIGGLAGFEPKPGQQGQNNDDSAWGGYLRDGIDEIASPASEGRILIDEILAKHDLAAFETFSRGLSYGPAPSRGRKRKPSIGAADQAFFGASSLNTTSHEIPPTPTSVDNPVGGEDSAR
jgi:hypothetical protein